MAKDQKNQGGVGRTESVDGRTVVVPDGMDGKAILEASDVLIEQLGVDRFTAQRVVLTIWPLIAAAIGGK